MSKSDYQKYLKYKKKYLTIKKHLRGGGECIEENESDLFINAVNNKKGESFNKYWNVEQHKYVEKKGLYKENKKDQTRKFFLPVECTKEERERKRSGAESTNASGSGGGASSLEEKKKQ